MSYTLPIYILDANILIRLASSDEPDHDTAQAALKKLRSTGVMLRTLPQSFFEFWVVATRPQSGNGLGLSTRDAEHFLNLFIQVYWPIPDDPALLTRWRELVSRYQVTGKTAQRDSTTVILWTHPRYVQYVV